VQHDFTNPGSPAGCYTTENEVFYGPSFIAANLRVYLLRIFVNVSDPFVFYRRKASFIQQLSSKLDVNGLVVCDHRVFVIGISSPTMEVFDAMSCQQLETLTISAMTDPWDIAARATNPYLYVFEGPYQVLRLNLNGQIVNSWQLDESQRALSVSRRNSVVITYSNRLEEFDNVGNILRSIRLDRSVSHASHSLSLDAEKFIVCHGSGLSSISHSVCLMDSEGRILNRYQESGRSTYQPLRLAVADHGCVLVADIHNRRLQILNQNISQTHNPINIGREQGGPLGVCYDSSYGNVYINTLDGKVLVYCIRTRSSLRSECFDVHSGLIPDQLTSTMPETMEE